MFLVNAFPSRPGRGLYSLLLLAMLAYSLSDDPAPEHFSDQVALYSDQQWRPLPYSREQIEADPELVTTEVKRRG